MKKTTLRRLTSNNFSDKQPVYSPDGKRIFFTTDESPLPDAAFGILHVAVVQATGGKSEFFTEDEVSTILPGLASDGKSLLLVKIDELSGRHSLWQYGLDGKPLRNLTERKFARIHRYITVAATGLVVIWGQEEPEQQLAGCGAPDATRAATWPYFSLTASLSDSAVELVMSSSMSKKS